VVEQHSARLARCLIFQDLAAEWIGRVLVDPGDVQRSAIGDRGMSVCAREKNRISGRDFVEIFARRKPRWFPESFDPAAPRDPFTALSLRHVRSNLCEET